MKNWKKTLTAALVLVTVCSGIYINWRYSQKQTEDFTDTLNADQILSEDALVLNPEDALEISQQEPETGDYFAAVRLSRQQARDGAVNLLQEAMSYDEGEQAEESSRQLENLVQTALSEAQIESLIVAKGYSDCVAYMSDDGISVAVAAPEEGLKEEDVAVITDVVLTQSDYEIKDIRVVEVPEN